MDKKEQNKWEERHFQICIALISRPNFNPYGNAPSPNFDDIINKADRMVALLQELEEEQTAKYEND